MIMRQPLVAKWLCRSLVLWMGILGLTTTASAEDCKLMRITTVPLTIDSEGRVLLPVRINGAEKHFVLSTGTGQSDIYPDAADSLQLHQWQLKSNREIYMGGAQAHFFVNVPEFEIGTAKITRLPLIVRPGNRRLAGIDGVLGSDPLDQFDVELDFAKSELTLFSRKHCPQQVVYWSSTYARVPFSMTRRRHAVFTATLDGQKVYTALDTGTGHTILSAQTAKERFGLIQGSPGMEPVSNSAPIDSGVLFSHRFNLLDLDGVAVKHPLIEVHSDDSKNAFDANHETDVRQHDAKYEKRLDVQELHLGTDVLRELHLYIAYGEQAVYFTSASAGPTS
jgi:predicted aspartyl protease